MSLPATVKTPNESIDYQFDWTTWLSGFNDTLASVVWTVPSGLTAGASSNSTTTATQTISGGSVGNDYVVTCKVTTTGGRIGERSFMLQVRANRRPDGSAP